MVSGGSADHPAELQSRGAPQIRLKRTAVGVVGVSFDHLLSTTTSSRARARPFGWLAATEISATLQAGDLGAVRVPFAPLPGVTGYSCIADTLIP